MHDPELTVIVTTHAEGRLLRPTLRSVSRAIVAAMADGVDCELLIVSDNADAATLGEISRWRTDEGLPFPVRALEVSVGESGAARNAGVLDARGPFVVLVDGDDLVSRNYLAAAVGMLRHAVTPTIVHPEYVISFGARAVIWRTDSSDHAHVSYRDLIRHNLWPSSAATTRDVYLAHPYRSLHPNAGYGPEDWTWNIDTTIGGATHVVAPGSVFFYRVRERGGVNNRHAFSILPAFDVGALRRALPPTLAPVTDDPAPHHPSTLRELAHRVYAAVLPAARWSTKWLSFEAKHAIYRTGRWALRLGAGTPEPAPTPPLPDAVTTALQDAAETDPAVSWTALQVRSLPVWRAHDDGYAEYLEAALNAIGDRGRAIVLVPWLGVGGADLVSLNYAKALQAMPAYADHVTILTTYLPERTRRDLIPDKVTLVQLDEGWLHFDKGMRNRLLAQLLVLSRPELVVSVNCFHFTDALQMFARQILDGTRAFVTLFAFDRIGPGYPTNPITDDAHREYLDLLDGVITDNTATAALLEDILALPRGRVIVHRQPAMDDVPALQPQTAATTDEQFSPTRPFRLLWPHRLDREKRPDVLVALAAELRRRGVPARIEIWGQRVLTSDDDTLMADLEAAGVVYHGPYSGGLGALPTAEYHAMLLTSQSEGLPLVLVQSMLLGLPVIASDVGGVSDIVVPDETGFLTRGPDDIAGYADAVEALMKDAARRRRIVHAAYAFAMQQHSWESFVTSVSDVFAPHVPEAAS